MELRFEAVECSRHSQEVRISFANSLSNPLTYRHDQGMWRGLYREDPLLQTDARNQEVGEALHVRAYTICELYAAQMVESVIAG
ncbi:MAG: hypothetical protein QW291_09755 [Thermofilaceae archaeon]